MFPLSVRGGALSPASGRPSRRERSDARPLFLAQETLVEALASTNASFAGTALRALHRGDPSDPLVASNALRIARDPSYPSSSRITALLILEDCVRSTSSTPSTSLTSSTLAETASAISAAPSASSLLRRTAEAVLERNAD